MYRGHAGRLAERRNESGLDQALAIRRGDVGTRRHGRRDDAACAQSPQQFVAVAVRQAPVDQQQIDGGVRQRCQRRMRAGGRHGPAAALAERGGQETETDRVVIDHEHARLA